MTENDWETYFDNVQSTPEKYGLRIIGTLEDPHASYSFDDLVVWQHIETGKLYWAVDSGCSCPSPFETYKSVESLTELTNKNWDEFRTAVENHCLPEEWLEDQTDTIATERTLLLAKTSRLLGGR